MPTGRRQSVEYFGWTFSPRMRPIAWFAALARLRVLDDHGFDLAVAADLPDLGRHRDLDLALVREAARLAHGGLERAEALAAVDEADWKPRRVLEAQRPVERRVAAADDHARLIAERLLALHEVVE